MQKICNLKESLSTMILFRLTAFIDCLLAFFAFFRVFLFHFFIFVILPFPLASRLGAKDSLCECRIMKEVAVIKNRDELWSYHVYKILSLYVCLFLGRRVLVCVVCLCVRVSVGVCLCQTQIVCLSHSLSQWDRRTDQRMERIIFFSSICLVAHKQVTSW